MVIACPSCQRKYQIDTSRIPSSGTSFTCWSCRATVRVDPLSAANAAGMGVATEANPTGAKPVSPPLTAESSIPLSAMRFFESLAAEASLNKQMADQAAKPVDQTAARQAAPPDRQPDPTPAPPQPPAAVEPEAAVAATSQPVTTAPTRAPQPTMPVRLAPQTMDLLAGDAVLDLPPLIPAEMPAVETGRVLDLPVPEPDDGDILSFVPVASAPVDVEPSRSTRAFASEPISPPLPRSEPPVEPPPEPAVPASGAATVSAETALGARVRPAPTPIPLPTPSVSSEPVAPPEPVRLRAPRPAPVPHVPAVPIPAPPPLAAPAEPSRPAPPPPARMTAAEMSVSPPAAWVAPGVESAPERPSRRLGVPVLVALGVVIVFGLLLWRWALRDLVAPSKPTPPAAQRTQPPPPVQQPPVEASGPPQAAQPPKPSDEAPASSAPKPEPVASATPAGEGNFTVQVRSSPSEADARGAVDALKSAGFDAYVMRADLGAHGVWYRVRVGRYATRDEARQAANKLRASGRAGDTLVQAYETPE